MLCKVWNAFSGQNDKFWTDYELVWVLDYKKSGFHEHSNSIWYKSVINMFY